MDDRAVVRQSGHILESRRVYSSRWLRGFRVLYHAAVADLSTGPDCLDSLRHRFPKNDAGNRVAKERQWCEGRNSEYAGANTYRRRQADID